MSAMKYVLKLEWGSQPLSRRLTERLSVLASCRSFVTEKRLGVRVHTAYTDFPLSCLVNYSTFSRPYHTDTRPLSTGLQSSSPDFPLGSPKISNWQKKKKLFLREAQEQKKKRHRNSRRTRIDRDPGFATLGMCDVVYSRVHQPSAHTLQI